MKKIVNNIIKTEQSTAVLIVRIVLGLVIFSHGAQSLIGWFGGTGFTNTMYYLTSIMQLPYIIALSVILLQFFGSILIILGVLVRPVALAISGMFVGMIVTVHLDHGFFMNWFGDKLGEGFEYHILVLALCAALMIEGAGRFSFDRLLFKQNHTL